MCQNVTSHVSKRDWVLKMSKTSIEKLQQKLIEAGFSSKIEGPVERTYAGKNQKRDGCHVWNVRVVGRGLLGSQFPLNELLKKSVSIEVTREHGYWTVDPLPKNICKV